MALRDGGSLRQSHVPARSGQQEKSVAAQRNVAGVSGSLADGSLVEDFAAGGSAAGEASNPGDIGVNGIRISPDNGIILCLGLD